MTDNTGYSVRKFRNGWDMVRRQKVYETLRREIDASSNPQVSELKGMEGLVFDFAHLVVTCENATLPSHDASPSDLLGGLLTWCDSDWQIVDGMRNAIATAEKKES